MRVLIFALLTAVAALGQKVTVEFDPAADFTRYKTFAIRDGQLNSKNPALNSELVKKQIEADIQRDLTARGLTMASGQADLNVRYRFGSARKAELERYPAGWRGIASEEKSEARKIEGKLDDMVRKAIEKYPPKPK